MAHKIYDRYGWPPDVVNKKMSIEEVKEHYKLISEVEKQEQKEKTELIKEFVKFISKLFKAYWGR